MKILDTFRVQGRVVGKVEGLLAIQGAPAIRQLLAGVQTEMGCSALATPILGKCTT